jgi:hypothetical protein
MVSGVIDMAQGKAAKAFITLLAGLTVLISFLLCGPTQYMLEVQTTLSILL